MDVSQFMRNAVRLIEASRNQFQWNAVALLHMNHIVHRQSHHEREVLDRLDEMTARISEQMKYAEKERLIAEAPRPPPPPPAEAGRPPSATAPSADASDAISPRLQWGSQDGSVAEAQRTMSVPSLPRPQAATGLPPSPAAAKRSPAAAQRSPAAAQRSP